MSKLQKIVFSFDERSYEPLEKMIRDGNYPSKHSYNHDDYIEIVVEDPKTKESRIIVIPKTPKNHSSFCDKCGRKL